MNKVPRYVKKYIEFFADLCLQGECATGLASTATAVGVAAPLTHTPHSLPIASLLHRVCLPALPSLRAGCCHCSCLQACSLHQVRVWTCVCVCVWLYVRAVRQLAHTASFWVQASVERRVDEAGGVQPGGHCRLLQQGLGLLHRVLPQRSLHSRRCPRPVRPVP